MHSAAWILTVACGPIVVVSLVLRGLGHRRARVEALKLFTTLNRR